MRFLKLPFLALLSLAVFAGGCSPVFAAVGGIVSGGGSGGLSGVRYLGPTTALGSILSNAPNGSTFMLSPGTFTVTPSVIGSNGVGAINLFSKTNITIMGVPGRTFIDGRTALGELLYITNGSGITISGITFLGRQLTNFTLYTSDYIMSCVSIYACERFTFEDNQIIDHFGHGILDIGSLGSWSTLSTNRIIVRRNYIENTGSQRSGMAVPFDGTAISPTGWIVEQNYLVANMRGIEPYDESVDGRVFNNCVIRNNTIVNCIDSAILTAGSTNGHDVVIEGNHIRWEPGYTRRGTNVNSGAFGISWNAGQRPRIRGNTIIRAPNRGIQVGSSLFIEQPEIVGNWIEETTNAVGNATGIEVGGGTTYTVSGPLVQGNTIYRARSEGIRFSGVRDALVTGNMFINPTSVAGEGAALRIISSTGVNSNMLVLANFIIDNRTGGAARLDYGIYVDAGAKAIRLFDNSIGGAGTASIQNLSGAEVTTR